MPRADGPAARRPFAFSGDSLPPAVNSKRLRATRRTADGDAEAQGARDERAIGTPDYSRSRARCSMILWVFGVIRKERRRAAPSGASASNTPIPRLPETANASNATARRTVVPNHIASAPVDLGRQRSRPSLTPMVPHRAAHLRLPARAGTHGEDCERHDFDW